MTKLNKIDLDSTPLDDEEKAIMDAFEKGLGETTLVSELTDERRARIEASAHVAMKPAKGANHNPSGEARSVSSEITGT